MPHSPISFHFSRWRGGGAPFSPILLIFPFLSEFVPKNRGKVSGCLFLSVFFHPPKIFFWKIIAVRWFSVTPVQIMFTEGRLQFLRQQKRRTFYPKIKTGKIYHNSTVRLWFIRRLGMIPTPRRSDRSWTRGSIFRRERTEMLHLYFLACFVFFHCPYALLGKIKPNAILNGFWMIWQHYWHNIVTWCLFGGGVDPVLLIITPQFLFEWIFFVIF